MGDDRLVSRLFTGDELRALLGAWEAAAPTPYARSQASYWSMHTYLAEAIIEADRLDTVRRFAKYVDDATER